MRKYDVVWILIEIHSALKMIFLDNLGNLNIDWDIDDRKELAILLGVRMALWLYKKKVFFWGACWGIWE